MSMAVAMIVDWDPSSPPSVSRLPRRWFSVSCFPASWKAKQIDSSVVAALFLHRLDLPHTKKSTAFAHNCLLLAYRRRYSAQIYRFLVHCGELDCRVLDIVRSRRCLSSASAHGLLVRTNLYAQNRVLLLVHESLCHMLVDEGSSAVRFHAVAAGVWALSRSLLDGERHSRSWWCLSSSLQSSTGALPPVSN